MKKKILKKIVLLVISTLAFNFVGCSKNDKDAKAIAVFVPGIIEDSPIYAKMVTGVKEAVEEFNIGKTKSKKVELVVFEAGTNQSEWFSQITSLAATQKYDVIFSSNPSLPELIKPLLTQFPNQKFIFADAFFEGSENMVTVSYKQGESAYLTGYIAGLMTKSNKIGLISAQEYPIMNNEILPEFKKGANASNLNVTVDFRIVGNWWDAKKGAELADAMNLNGVDVIPPICGGAVQGVIASAKEHNFYLCGFDSNTYKSAPNLVISCVVNLQEKLCKELTLDYLNNKIQWGTAKSVGIKEGYIKFVDDDPLYIQTVPENVRNEIAAQINLFKGK